jgi:pyrroloquinoline quinone (PQQ) biosynthesis protein C
MHYTGSVTRHMTRAAAHAEDCAEGWTLLTHNSQEWDHYALFRSAAASVGLSEAALTSSRPLPGTLAITHLMRRIARRHPLVYNACEAMLEATAERPERVVEFFETVRDRYDYPRAFIDPLIEHLHVDEEFEHIDIFDGLVADLTTVSFDLMSEIMTSCQELADTMYAWHAQVAHHYSRIPSVDLVLTGR